MIGRDAIAGLAVVAASLFLFWLTLGLERNPLVPIGPGFYPRIVLGITAVFGAALIAFDVLKKKLPRPIAKANYAAVTLQFIVFGLYVAALPLLGFRIATFAYVAAASAILDRPRSARGWMRAVLLALVTAAVTWFVFERYLSVLLPRGHWTDF